MICFFRRTTHVHIWLLRHSVLFLVYNCPGQQDPQSSRKLNTYGIWWIENLLFLQSLPQHCRIATMGARWLGQSIAGWHLASLWPFACKNIHLHCHQRGLHCILMWLMALVLTCNDSNYHTHVCWVSILNNNKMFVKRLTNAVGWGTIHVWHTLSIKFYAKIENNEFFQYFYSLIEVSSSKTFLFIRYYYYYYYYYYNWYIMLYCIILL